MTLDGDVGDHVRKFYWGKDPNVKEQVDQG